jgi:hypothetical protein
MKNVQTSLIEKLQQVANGNDVELTPDEAELYGVDVADHLPDEDLIEEVDNG